MIEKYKAEREQKVEVLEQYKEQIEAAQARIADIDALLAAYSRLTGESVSGESNVAETEESEVKNPVNRGALCRIDVAISNLGSKSFEVSDIAKITGLSRQTVRRLLNDEVSRGELRIVEQGSRGRRTVYQEVQS
jgi:Fic family protein